MKTKCPWTTPLIENREVVQAKEACYTEYGLVHATQICQHSTLNWKKLSMKLSRLAEQTETSPILLIAEKINARKQRGETVYNLTVGDFDPSIFPIPEGLTNAVIDAYRRHQTNYPGATGLPHIREQVARMLNQFFALDYKADDVIIASGARPIIYSLYRTVVDPGDKVVYPVPSWNNESYAALLGAKAVPVETALENSFMPTADMIAPQLADATLLALCSPQNPTGTVFDEASLTAICELVVSENRRRGANQKPLYVMFDQVYWALTFGNAFRHPLTVCPGIRKYAIFVDGLSKSFAGTGVRVGWATGPRAVIGKMSTIIAHIGAWAPRPEQTAVGVFLADEHAVEQHLIRFRERLEARLHEFYAGFMALKASGHAVDAIAPQAAIYLSVRIDLHGRKTPNGQCLDDENAVQKYLLDDAGIGVLPFSWFGAKNHKYWFRLSVGTCRREHIPAILAAFEVALNNLS